MMRRHNPPFTEIKEADYACGDPPYAGAPMM
jgi:hypothetical protein